jgi:stearoyl-CoA desaturase (delta-9 desaturase)
MIKITHNQTVRTLQVINHVLALIGIVYAIYSGEYSLLFVSLVTYWIIGILGINIGYHRLLSHRSFKTHRFWEELFSLIGVITVVGSPLAWVAVHRQHHRSTEKPGDPHSPYLLGNFRAWFGLWNMPKLDLKLVRDMREDEFQRDLHKGYLLIILLWVFVIFLYDPLMVIYTFAIPACLCLHSTSAIIVIAHRHGYRPYPDVKDQSRNSWIANLITLGEGWHNTHHAKPYAWNNQERWWEFDIPAYIIRLIKK